jgi:hypothetical protein
LIFSPLLSTLIRWFSAASAIYLSWWGVWQLPWVQRQCGHWLTAALEQQGVPVSVDRVSFDWRGRWVVEDLRAHLDGHRFEASELRVRWGLLSFWEAVHGRWSIEGASIQGASWDQSALSWIDKQEWSAMASSIDSGWSWRLAYAEGMSAEGCLIQDGAAWRAEADLAYWGSGWVQGSVKGAPPSGHFSITGSADQWRATGVVDTQAWSIGPSDTLEGQIRIEASGRSGGWRVECLGEGLWDHDGQDQAASLAAQMHGSAAGWVLDRVELDLPFLQVCGKASLGEQAKSHWTIRSADLQTWSLLRSYWMPSCPNLKGRAECELDWIGSGNDQSIACKMHLTQGQIGWMHVGQLKGELATYVGREGWLEAWQSCRGHLHLNEVSWEGSHIDQLMLAVEPDEQGLKGSLAAVGLCGGRLQLNSNWTLLQDRLTVEQLTGTLFGQYLSNEEPLVVLAQSDSWLTSRGLSIPALQCRWGDGSVSGWAELGLERWQGHFEGLHTPLDWVGIAVRPLECTGFGDVQLTLGGDARAPHWHANLQAEGASALIGPLTGNCSTELSLDGTLDELIIEGRVGIHQAELGLNTLSSAAAPRFDLQWTGADPGAKTKRTFAVRYDIDLDCSDSTCCSVGPIESSWRGHLRLTGANGAPELAGTLEMEPTHLVWMGFPIELEEGKIGFEGVLPEQIHLDLRARTPLLCGSAYLRCSGSAEEPCVSVESDEQLTPEQLLDQLAKLAQQHNEPAIAKQLQQALQWLPRADAEAIARLRRETGLDRVEAASKEGNREALQLLLGPQLTERLLVQLHQQLGADISGLAIESGESLSSWQGRSFALQTGTTLAPAGRFAIRWKMHY